MERKIVTKYIGGSLQRDGCSSTAGFFVACVLQPTVVSRVAGGGQASILADVVGLCVIALSVLGCAAGVRREKGQKNEQDQTHFGCPDNFIVIGVARKCITTKIALGVAIGIVDRAAQKSETMQQQKKSKSKN